MMPVTICCTQFGSPCCEQPIWMTAMIAAPQTVPITVPLPPEQAAAADDHGGNDVELEADGDRRIADREPRELQHAGEPGEHGRQRVDLQACAARSARRTGARSARSSRWRRDDGRIACSRARRRRQARGRPSARSRSAGRASLPSRAVRSRSFSQVIGASIRRSSARPFAAPRTSSIVPSVTMNGTTRRRVIRSPLTAPHIAAAATRAESRNGRIVLRTQEQRDHDGARATRSTRPTDRFPPRR